MSVFMAEEQRRIEQFVYQRDAKFALVRMKVYLVYLHKHSKLRAVVVTAVSVCLTKVGGALDPLLSVLVLSSILID